jgi:23S rRNA (uracil1939-C5)-methyltransferase
LRNKNRILEGVIIEDLASNGKGVGRHEGKVVFVPKAIPGDVLDLRVVKNKSDFMEAKTLRVVKPSEDRGDAFCSHFGVCGGCPIQNVRYEKQLSYKEKMVVDAFKRIAKHEAGEFIRIKPSEKTKYFRNKLEFTFSKEAWLTKEEMDSGKTQENVLGFHAPGRFDKIVNIDRCFLQKNVQNDVRNWIKSYADDNNISYYDIRRNKGVLRNLICRTSTIGELMVILSVATAEQVIIIPIMEAIKKAFPEITSLNYVINEKKNDSIHDLKVLNYSGEDFIEEEMGGMRFKIRPKSFFQTNTYQAQRLYELVKDFAKLDKQDIVFDLYTGTGTIANFLAPLVNKVIGIEIIEEAIDDAKENAIRNNNDNAFFFVGDVKDQFVKDLFEKEGKPSVVITNPARAGMHSKVLESLLDISPDRIIYVSCNPATQARDVGYLKSKYDLIKLCPVDMFPHTLHVENVALLKKR